MVNKKVASKKFFKRQRLLTPADFRHVFDNYQKKIHQPHLMAFICPNDLENSRLGMAITKKKIPTAVQRNKIKRHIRENFRIQATTLPDVDIVFIVKKNTKDLPNEQLDNEINIIFHKVSQYNKNKSSVSIKDS